MNLLRLKRKYIVWYNKRYHWKYSNPELRALWREQLRLVAQLRMSIKEFDYMYSVKKQKFRMN